MTEFENTLETDNILLILNTDKTMDNKTKEYTTKEHKKWIHLYNMKFFYPLCVREVHHQVASFTALNGRS